MECITEYSIKPGTDSVRMPKGSRIMQIAAKGDDICLWAFGDTTRLDELRHFETYQTGDLAPNPQPHESRSSFVDPARCGSATPDDGVRHIGSVWCSSPACGQIAWHVFERRA